MHLTFRNVNDVFRGLVQGIHTGAIPTCGSPSRYGEVKHSLGPVLVTYSHPAERVLFNAARDVNPYSLLYEALWMLAARKDVAALSYYTQRFRTFSDDGTILYGAYGWRWRVPWGDQLRELVLHLRANPSSRRAVLALWSGHDLYKADDRNGDYSKDLPCNLNVCFSVRAGRLEMTVFNRSNDLVWGLAGANAVCFSVLQEYLAAHLGLKVGSYHQITNDLHVYTANWRPEAWLADATPDHYQPTCGRAPVRPVPLLEGPARFEQEVVEFVERHAQPAREGHYQEPFLRDVAQPLCMAFHAHKRREYAEAFRWLRDVSAEDWHLAAEGWLERREQHWRQRQSACQTS